MTDLGGFSGGPVFIETTSDSGLWHLKFAGIVYEGGPLEGTDIFHFFVTRASFINEDGSINRF